MYLFDVCGVYAQDHPTLKVVECLEFDEAEECDVRDGNKIGRSAIGKLTRSRLVDSSSHGTKEENKRPPLQGRDDSKYPFHKL